MSKLTENDRLAIAAAHAEGVSNVSLAKKYGVAESTIRRALERPETARKYKEKVKENVEDIYAYMDGRKEQVLDIIALGLDLLPEKLREASSVQITTALGTLIDKWTLAGKNRSGEEKEYGGVPSTMIAPVFATAVFDISEREHTEYVFPGGRGSAKSSFISLMLIDRLMRSPGLHAAVLRQVGNTLRSTVFTQVQWAIDMLGLTDEFKYTVSPLEITRISTGQKIYFRGADDPGKLKSIKAPFGHIGVLWFEELDQFGGEEAVRKIEQSVIRGGDEAYIFKSFNPPKSANNWANLYIRTPKEKRLVTMSCYTDVPAKWLGRSFLDEAEFLKEVNPSAYENEYLGVANGTGGAVFDNVELRTISDDEIGRFDRLYRGVDWGWFPDPFQYVCCYFDKSRLTLYIIDEYRANKQSNAQTAKVLKERGVGPDDVVICDSAENKSVQDYKDEGIRAVAAKKPPGSVEYGMKWLQSLRAIVIDNVRCPNAAAEFVSYEYDRDKDGNVISGYPDENNHAIDAVRYAMNRECLAGRVRVLT